MSVCCGVGPIVDAINSGNVSVRRGGGGISATSGDSRPAMDSHCRGECLACTLLFAELGSEGGPLSLTGRSFLSNPCSSLSGDETGSPLHIDVAGPEESGACWGLGTHCSPKSVYRTNTV